MKNLHILHTLLCVCPMPASKSERVQIVISKAKIERLDAWRASRQIWSRSDAIRRLITEGIDQDKRQQARPAHPKAAETVPVNPAGAETGESEPAAGAAKKPAKPRRGAKAGSAVEASSSKQVVKRSSEARK